MADPSHTVLRIPLRDLRRRAQLGLREMALLRGVVRLLITASGELEVQAWPLESIVKDVDTPSFIARAAERLSILRRTNARADDDERVEMAAIMASHGYRLTMLGDVETAPAETAAGMR